MTRIKLAIYDDGNITVKLNISIPPRLFFVGLGDTHSQYAHKVNGRLALNASRRYDTLGDDLAWL